MEPKLMSLREAAAYLELEEKSVSRLADDGDLPATKVTGQWRFERPAVEAWKAKRTTVRIDQQHLPPEATGIREPLSIAGVLATDRIKLELAAEGRDGVLRELVELVIDPQEQRLCEVLFQALKSREDLCPTCVNEGVAIPHARNALVGLVDRPLLAYGRHRAGVPFGAFDGKPIHHFFLLCAPNVREHLLVLSRLARILSRKELRTRLAAAEKPAQVIQVIRQAEQSLTPEGR